jgi:hypothetical protein
MDPPKPAQNVKNFYQHAFTRACHDLRNDALGRAVDTGISSVDCRSYSLRLRVLHRCVCVNVCAYVKTKGCYRPRHRVCDMTVRMTAHLLEP